MIGETLSKFHVLRRIGRGGMASVYLGEHELIGTKAAIKVLLPVYCQDAKIVNRFFNEARAAGAIKHPGIIEIYDFGHHESGTAYIIMEYVEGESLSKRLKRLGHLSVGQALSVMRHTASCLSHAHAAGIIHRDLKPGNIMFSADADVPGGERVKLLDFGIAKLLDTESGEEHATRAGAVLGTPSYMAPEQSGDSSAVDHRADLYALGCVGYEMLCGQPPFPGNGVGELLVAHRTQPVPPMRNHNPNVPESTENLIRHLLEKEAANRFQTAPEVVEVIDSLLAQSGLSLSTATGRTSPNESVPYPPPSTRTGPGTGPYPHYSSQPGSAPQHGSLPQHGSSSQHGSQPGQIHRGDPHAAGLRDSQVGANKPPSLAGYESRVSPTRVGSSRLAWPILGGLLLAGAAAVTIVYLNRSQAEPEPSTNVSGNARAIDAGTGPDQTVTVSAIADASPSSNPRDAAVTNASIDAAVETKRSIKLRSKPRAFVFRDGKKLGRTPFQIELLPRETAELSFRARGYRDLERLVSGDGKPIERIVLKREPRSSGRGGGSGSGSGSGSGDQSVNPF